MSPVIIGILSIAVLVWLALELDRYWYKKHPETNKDCTEIDESLTKQGK